MNLATLSFLHTGQPLATGRAAPGDASSPLPKHREEPGESNAVTRPSAPADGPLPLSPRPVDGLGDKAHEALLASAEDAAMSDELSPEEQEQVDQLRARDVEVRRHEEAHARVGGEYAGQPSYTYQTGPDGKRYAIGGEVPIDVAPIPDDPEATIDKMLVVKAAALAPAEPSDADRRVAALADAQRLQAQSELYAQNSEANGLPDIADSAKTLSGRPESGELLDLVA